MTRRLWPLVVAAVSLGVDAYVLAGVLPRIAADLGTGVAAVGLGVTAFTAAYAVAGPTLSGRLTRTGTARALLVALGLFNVGNLVTAIAAGLPLFLASRVVAGVGAGVLTAVATATAAAMVEQHERGRAMSLVTFGLSTGTVAGVPLGMLVGERFGWRWTMALVVAVGVVSMAAVATRRTTLPPLPTTAAASPLAVVRDPRTIVGVAAAFLLGVASLGLYTYVLPMAQDRGLGGTGFALVWAWGVGGVAGSAAVGRPLDRHGPRPLLVGLPALLLVAFALLTLSTSPATWLVAAALWGAAGWASVPTLQQALTQHAPERAMSVVAFQMAAMYLGSAAGAAAGGALLAAGVRAGTLAGWALAPAGLALVLTAAVAPPGRGNRPTTTPEPATATST
ncbi:MFS transporter [Cellulomonas sp. HD19AZ1]|uniref:MFS transporter n=1 Tax=Cellulomonas sp. HD19AZ1 TaxID=2559593 RepID=UPI001070F831|nr:MFS transporter [Cellulomonas sp. HD19AZ1]TFH69436.1 MFS transporter [Cellulomonas sp. HD19AZ1]